MVAVPVEIRCGRCKTRVLSRQVLKGDVLIQVRADPPVSFNLPGLQMVLVCLHCANKGIDDTGRRVVTEEVIVSALEKSSGHRLKVYAEGLDITP